MRLSPLLLLAIAAPALAQTTPAPPPPPPSAAPAAPAAPAAAPNPDDQIRCRRMAVTGSIARFERVCKTVGEWRRLAQNGNDAARATIEYSTSRPSGGT